MLLNKNILVSALIVAFLAISGEAFAGITKTERAVETEEISNVAQTEHKIAFVKVRKQTIKIFTRFNPVKAKTNNHFTICKAAFQLSFCTNKQHHYLQFRRLLI
jgi:hypothetical protein